MLYVGAMTTDLPESAELPGYLRNLNPPQREAATATEGPLLVLAGAGTGKTRVLITRVCHLLVTRKAFANQILAVTFTNKAAAEMRHRIAAVVGDSVEAMWLGTFHALAARILRRHAELVGLKPNFTILDQDDQIRLLKQLLQAENIDDKKWPPRIVHGVFERWKDRGLTPDKVGGDPAGEVAGGQAAKLYALYQDRLKTLNACDFGDLLLHNLTLFTARADVLAEYHKRFRYILVDEYQDTNVAQYMWLRLLAQASRNLCCVGDDDQCVVAGTRVAMADGRTRRVEDVRVGDAVLSAHGAGEFRAARVERIHRRRKRRDLVRIRTVSGKELVTTPEHAHFADMILHESPQRHFVYLMYRQGSGYRLGVSQIYTKGQRHPVIGYQQRCLHERGDAVWLVRAFESDVEARAAEHTLSLRFAVTTLPFVARKGAVPGGIVADQVLLDALHADLRPAARAAALMAEFGLDPDSPHFRPQGAPGRRRNLIVTLNAERRGTTPMHRIAVSGNDAAGAKALAAAGLPVRRYKRNPANWRFETLFRDVERLEAIRKKVEVALDTVLVRKANIHGKALSVRPAAQVVPGMVVATQDGHEVVTAVERIARTADVYDLDVAGTHNFIAGGIVTHNSIYGWRGAEVGNILRFEKDFPGAKVVRLEQNYRSSEHILAAASGLIAHNRARLGKTLWTAEAGGERVSVRPVWDGEQEAGFVADEIEALQRAGEKLGDIAILVRAGFQTREFEERFITLGIPYRVIGGPRFYEREEIRDAIAYFRVIVQPDDDLAFERIVNKPRRGIGDATVQLLQRLARGRGMPLLAAAETLVTTDELKPAARNAVRRVVEDFARWRAQVERAHHAELAATVLDESGYTRMWQEDKSPEAPGKLENLKELVAALEEYDDLPAFLEHVSLVMENAGAAPADMASLMTLHAAKGLEFGTVFLPGWEEGLFPHPRALDEKGEAGLEEERRLAHVGLTRARRRAYVSFAANRRIHGMWQSSVPSRFVAELPPERVDVKSEPGLWGDGPQFRDARPALAEPSRRFGHGPRRAPLIEATAREIGGLAPGMRVFHQKFGYGRVLAAEHGKLEVEFEHTGTKHVMESFVEKA